MPDCCASALDAKFDARRAAQQLRDYRRSGAAKETRLLVSALREAGIEGSTLLDIGAGIGAVQDGAFESGAVRAVSVDASGGYVQAARTLAAERGYLDRVDYRVGDFVDVADSVPAADVVTLDKVICCYPDMDALVSRSAERATRLYAAVYPRDGWPVRAVAAVLNAVRSLGSSTFRSYIHRVSSIERVLERQGFRPRSTATTLVWKIVVFERSARL